MERQRRKVGARQTSAVLCFLWLILSSALCCVVLNSSTSSSLTHSILFFCMFSSSDRLLHYSSPLHVKMNVLLFFCLFFFLIISSVSASDCDQCVVQTKAAVFSNFSTLYRGACGYGFSAIAISNGNLAAAIPSLYKKGAGCGACFQIRCKNTRFCTNQGTRITVTDVNSNEETDFVLSSRAFKAMAHKGYQLEILKLRSVDVEYRRIPCEYTKNMGVYLEETSKKGEYLAVKFLYQGGQTEILIVDVAQVGFSNWMYMTRKNKGAVWETSFRVPAGPLKFRIAVIGGFDAKTYWLNNVIPDDWKVGVTYDSGVRIDDIAVDTCTQCGDDGSWK